jgi:putative tributyrin esterase
MFLQHHWHSTVLARNVTTWVLHPDVGSPPFPALYLLHGLGDDHTTWMRRTRLEWYAANSPFLIVMPDGGRSFYTNAESGPRYADHIALELPGMIERTFAARPDAKSIAGQSMGGYGAFRLALGYPGRFKSASSHGGGLLRPMRPLTDPPADREWPLLFGPNPAGSSHDLIELARRAKSAGELPALRIDCGLEDHLLDHNRAYHAELTRLAIPHEYAELPGGHNWDYWDQQLPEMLAFHGRFLA